MGVSVSPSYLAKLADLQDEAATTFSSAASAVSGLAHTVSSTHGVICDASKGALQSAQDAHNRAAIAMENYSKALSTWLRSAASAYENADEMAAHNLNRQIT